MTYRLTLHAPLPINNKLNRMRRIIMIESFPSKRGSVTFCKYFRKAITDYIQFQCLLEALVQLQENVKVIMDFVSSNGKENRSPKFYNFSCQKQKLNETNKLTKTQYLDTFLVTKISYV